MGSTYKAFFYTWLTQQSYGGVDDWVFMCGSSSSVYGHGKRLSGGGSAPGTVVINLSPHANEVSDFGVAEVMLFNRELSQADMVALQTYQAALLTGA